MHRSTTRHTLRRALAAAACSAALLTLAACGGDDEPSGSSETSSEASDTASESPSASPSEGSSEESPAVDEETNAELSERIQSSIAEGKTAHVEMAIEAQEQSMTSEGDVDFTTDPMSMRLVMTGSTPGEVEILSVGGTVYIKAPDTGGKYMSLSADQAGSMLGFDPESMLSELEGVAGGEKVDDDHYRYQMEAGTTDVYFEDDRLSKLVTEGAGIGTVTMTYSDWGKDVEIVAPPAAEVQQMPGM